MRKLTLLLAIAVAARNAYGAFGMELGPLLKLVSGQVMELEKLAQISASTKDQTRVLRTLNEGIDKTVDQIETVQAIIDRAQGLDPSSIRSIRELNEYLGRVKDLKERVDQVMRVRLRAADLAIAQGSLQGDTAYRMGQEMIGTGSQLAQDSRQASPGRAAQITASSSSAQMMAKGVELQTMAQMVQLQAMLLDLEKAQVEKEMLQREKSRDVFLFSLEKGKGKGGLK
ncbi:MAG: hypothetical protein KGP28_07520 [Bdellovibrionales bacterium]|nr:hypothetical protein [Bdellovibrionales bacterium]